MLKTARLIGPAWANCAPFSAVILLLAGLWLPLGCGSTRQVNETEDPASMLSEVVPPLYNGEMVEVHQAFYEGGNPPPASCSDGNTSSRSLHRITMDANCLVTHTYNCVVPPLTYDPNLDQICKAYPYEQTVLDPNICITLRSAVFSYHPMGFADRYDCETSQTCSLEETTKAYIFNIDGAKKVVTYNDSAAPIFSKEFAAIRQLLGQYGFY